MRVIIAGSRNFNDYDYLERCCDMLLDSPNLWYAVLSGNAKGADTLGERYAKENHMVVYQYPANWDEHGKAAGHIRNEEMAKNADILVAFWDGSSKGTKDMIELAMKYKLEVHIFPYEKTD